jgi:lysyl-tRNA synthetase class II
VNVKTYTLLAKSLLPLPEKWHGLTDTETRFRQRYVDHRQRRSGECRRALRRDLRHALSSSSAASSKSTRR